MSHSAHTSIQGYTSAHQRQRSDTFFDDDDKAPFIDIGLDTPREQSRWQRHRRKYIGSAIVFLIIALYVLSPSQLKPSPFQAQASNPENNTVVIASYEGQALGWTADLSDSWNIARYTLPRREHYTYLYHIIENYDNLPPYTVFLHGHLQAWHQIEPVDWKIQALNTTSLDREGFINLRCAHDMGCTTPNPKDPKDDTLDTYLGSAHEPPSYPPLARRVGTMLRPFWEELLKPYGFGEYPKEIGALCCGQFAVTRAAIRSQPVAFYKGLMQPLRESTEKWRGKIGEQWNEDHSGNVYEYLWHIFFGRPAVDCVDTGVCHKEFFSDAIECDRLPGRPNLEGGYKKIQCRNKWNGEVWPPKDAARR